MSIVSVPKKWDHVSDIIIVGAGTAGLAAAITARDLSADVTVLETMPYCASSLSLIEIGPAFAGTDVQRERGIIDSPEEYFKDGIERAKGVPELWRLFIDHQLDTYYWCKSLGMKFDDLIETPGHKIKRCFMVNGVEWLRILQETAEKKGVQIEVLHRALRLITDNNQLGKVLGLQVRVGDKIKYFKAKRAVIIATGGFGRNKDMVVEYGPEYVDCIPIMPPGHLGDGLTMAFAIGGASKGIGIAVKPSFQIDEVSKSGNMGFITYAGGIFVNIDGKRFWDESTRENSHVAISEESLRQPQGGAFWVVYDDRIRKNVLPTKFGKAKALQANSIESLAQDAGINVTGLNETVEKYNSDIDSVGYDRTFNRKTLVGYEGSPVKIEKPPFHAIKCLVALSSCKGGLKVNTRLQVIDRFDDAIPGLYACGEVVGGLWGSNGMYIPCTTLSSSLTFGRIAGRNGATEL